MREAVLAASPFRHVKEIGSRSPDRPVWHPQFNLSEAYLAYQTVVGAVTRARTETWLHLLIESLVRLTSRYFITSI